MVKSQRFVSLFSVDSIFSKISRKSWKWLFHKLWEHKAWILIFLNKLLNWCFLIYFGSNDNYPFRPKIYIKYQFGRISYWTLSRHRGKNFLLYIPSWPWHQVWRQLHPSARWHLLHSPAQSRREPSTDARLKENINNRFLYVLLYPKFCG